MRLKKVDGSEEKAEKGEQNGSSVIPHILFLKQFLNLLNSGKSTKLKKFYPT